MNEIKVGDEVICVEPIGTFLSLYKTYIVFEESGNYIKVENSWYCVDRFKLLEDYIKELIEKGLIQDAIQRGYIKISDYLAVIASNFIKENKCNLPYDYVLIEEIVQFKSNNMEELKITKERVLETIKKYPISKDILEELFPEVKKEEKFYKVGQKFIRNYVEYILCRAIIDNFTYVGLIKMDTGNCWSNFIRVENAYRITLKELLTITKGYDFKLIT